MFRATLKVLAKPRCGIVGLPNVGKSTMFNALTKSHGETGNQPFVTIDPNMGQAIVVDSRLDRLLTVEEHKRAKKIPSYVDVWDIAGLVKGAGEGEGLGNKFLSHIRECNALLHMVRCYDDDSIIHMEGKVDPLSDINIINNELAVADLQSITKQGTKLKPGKDPKLAVMRTEVLEKCESVLLSEKSLFMERAQFTQEEWEFVSTCNFLTAKEMIFVCNIDEDAAASGGENKHSKRVREAYGKENTVCTISASIEQEAAHMTPEDGLELLNEFGITRNQAEAVTLAILEALKLKIFFTAGPLEVRSWLCNASDNVRQASGTIHSEFPERCTKVDLTPLEKYIASNGSCEHTKTIQPQHVADDGDVLYFHIDQTIKLKK